MPIVVRAQSEGDRDRGDRRVTSVAHQALSPEAWRWFVRGSRIVACAGGCRTSRTSSRALDIRRRRRRDASVGAELAIRSSRPAGDARAPIRHAAALVGLLLAACSATAPSAARRSPPRSRSRPLATHDGVQVALGVNRARVAPGGDVAATVVVRNGAPGAVTWQGGGCELQGQFTVTPLGQAAPAPAGQAWPGDKGVIKELALPEATAIRIPVPAEFAACRGRGVAFGCTPISRSTSCSPARKRGRPSSGSPRPRPGCRCGRRLRGRGHVPICRPRARRTAARLRFRGGPHAGHRPARDHRRSGAADPAGGGGDGRDPRRSGVHGRARAAPAPDLGVDLDALGRRRLGRPGAVPAGRPARGPGRPGDRCGDRQRRLAGDRTERPLSRG